MAKIPTELVYDGAEIAKVPDGEGNTWIGSLERWADTPLIKTLIVAVLKGFALWWPLPKMRKAPLG